MTSRRDRDAVMDVLVHQRSTSGSAGIPPGPGPSAARVVPTKRPTKHQREQADEAKRACQFDDRQCAAPWCLRDRRRAPPS